MSKKQLGGLKLDPKLIGDKTGFNPVFSMIQNNTSEVKILTYKSLKGFMFTLKLQNDDGVYLDLNNKYNFTERVNNYILKLVVVTGNSVKNLDQYNTYDKESEKEDDFIAEAINQQQIWINSIAGGHTEISPSVANLSLFDSKNANYLIENILKKNNSNDETKNILQYLNQYFDSSKRSYQPSYKLGVLTMKNYINAQTFESYINNIGIRINDRITNLEQSKKDKMNNILMCIITKIIRLFLAGYIHFDLHDENFLVINGKDCVIIDFGRVSNLNDGNDDEYLDTNTKKILNNDRGKLFNYILSYKNNNNINMINYIMNKIDDLDLKNNINGSRNFSQMSFWYKLNPNNDIRLIRDIDPFIEDIFKNHNDELIKKIREEIEVVGNPKITKNTLDNYMRNGILFNVAKNIDYNHTFPLINLQPVSNLQPISNLQPVSNAPPCNPNDKGCLHRVKGWFGFGNGKNKTRKLKSKLIKSRVHRSKKYKTKQQRKYVKNK